jgi:hypothetical protein
MAIVVAPLVAQFSVLLAPEAILAGLALKELIVGLLAVVTVMVTVDVVEPAELVAVSVYAVVVAGITFVDPFADAEVNVPGVMAIVEAPLVDQASMLLAPELIPEGLAVKEAIAGIVPLSGAGLDEPQPEKPAHTNRMRAAAQSLGPRK